MNWILLLLLFRTHVQGTFHLFDTEDGRLVEEYDCIYHTKNTPVKYCRRPGTNITLNRLSDECLNGGERLSFQSLLEQNVSTDDLLRWSISLEQVDDYAYFVHQTNHHQQQAQIVVSRKYVCRCTIEWGTFGKFCEYRFLDGTTSFEQSISDQFSEKQRNHLAAQHHGDILCYQTPHCYSGLLCLDWRNICDGEQQCYGGYDEMNCDLLEFNECDENEFRCRNGMCIPEEYWLDGETDCMDRSDEKSFQSNIDCFYSTDHFRCDESLCLPGTWSCGDGQCIEAWNRFGYQRLIVSDDYCLSLRELNHMCEASHRWRLWTYPQTGLCTNQTDYDDPECSLSQTVSSIAARCLYLIRCALSQGLEKDCPCRHSNCSQIIVNQCGSDDFYAFPAYPLVRSYMFSLYHTKHNWLDPTPDGYEFVGEILCRGYYAKISETDSKGINIFPTWLRMPHAQLDFEFCRKATIKDRSGPQFDPFCWSNRSRTFNGQSYSFDPTFCVDSHRCLSHYRARDRTYDCVGGDDEQPEMTSERFCRRIQKHRFSCSKQEHYCIGASSISYLNGLCSDGYDRYVVGSDRALKSVECRSRDDPDCQMLREYIYNSSIRNTSHISTPIQSQSRFPLHWYCDSFWDTSSHIDESIEFCQKWICPQDHYKCQTGQCIPITWVCDGEWDCSDASDEEALLSIHQFSEHNQRLIDLPNRIDRCYQKYSKHVFSKICNTSLELPCLQRNASNPLNFTQAPPCLPFNRVGDGIEDCIGGHDEKNTVDCQGSMLGFALHGSDGTCYAYKHHCSEYIDDPHRQWWCFYRKENSSFCSNDHDVICFDGSCQPDARCNGVLQCTHGEDEYLCVPDSYNLDYAWYRQNKEYLKMVQRYHINWLMHPSSSMRTGDINSLSEAKHRQTIREEENAFICNRGVTVGWTKGRKVCFCPPAYYGNKCQFYSDRLTVITHVNITEPMSRSMFRVIAILYSNEFQITITHHEFLVNGTFERNNPIKHKFTLLYSRLASLMTIRRYRYLNREQIVTSQPFSIHFNLFLLNPNEIIELGRWVYPIYFDFLPSFRLAKVLTIPDQYFDNRTNYTCHNNTCPSDSTCLPIFNQPNQFYCSCHNRYGGDQCEHELSFCSSYCSSESICKPTYRGLLSNVDRPFCVCPLGYYGSRCYIRHNECQSQPCLNNGTCHLTYDSTKENPYRCECSLSFYGRRCEKRKALIVIQLNFPEQTTALVSVMQFCDVFQRTFEILVQDQQLIRGLPSIVSYNHPSLVTPILGILKTYENLIDSKYWIVYLMLNMSSIQMISTPQRCLPFRSFEDDKTQHSDIPIAFKYHQICRQFEHLYCFYSDDYLCTCESDHYRTACFTHDIHSDQCNLCFVGGKCLRGDARNPKDFLCICPRCYQGDRCQFSMEAFGSTIDSLLSSYRSTVTMTYLLISGSIFLLGLLNNICSFLTFKRTVPRQTAVGQTLLVVTLLNKLSLLCLFLKFVHNFIGLSSWVIPDRLNWILCKILSYFLSVSTRSFYWLASWITIDRLLIVVFPTEKLFKQPRLSKLISSVTILIISLMHWHELFYYTIIEQSSSTVCVTHFQHASIANYNRVTTFIHYLVPFAIQVISITLLIVNIVRSRARAKDIAIFSKSFIRRQIMLFKELYITPLAIAISALPQVTVSFTLACQELVSWEKHFLLCTYLLSYVPQIFAFFLFVLPSSAYKKEFEQTWIGRNLFA